MSKKTWWVIVVIVIVLIAIGVWSAKKGEAPVTSGEGRTASVTFAALNASGENGTATISEMDGKVKVILNVQGAPAGVEQPAHIHKGACPTPGDVVYPLNSVVNGVSETVLDATVDALVGGLPLAVNVHKSQSEVNMYVACGDVVAF